MNTNKSSISVIVPIYKVEPYIRQCIESLINQTRTVFEIILVDDGSPDNCPAICDEYAEKYENIKVVHKENGGLVSARKEGLIRSTGAYVTFIDGDDWIDDLFIEQYSNIIERYQPDIVSTDTWFLATEKENKEIKINNHYAGMYNKSALEESVYPEVLYSAPFFNFGVAPSLWSKIIRSELLKAVFSDLPENLRMGEDLAATLPCMLMANSIYFGDFCRYYYRQTPTSITHTFDLTAPYRVDSLLGVLEKETDCYGNKYCIKKQIAMYAVYITEFTVVSLIKGSPDFKRDLKSLEVLWNNKTVKRGLKLKVRIRTRVLFAISKSKQIWLMKLIRRLKYGKELSCAKQ